MSHHGVMAPRAWVFVATLFAISALARGGRIPENPSMAEPTSHDGLSSYELAARFNERIVASIDAIDTALTAVIAGNVAVLVFAIDKIKELHRVAEWWALGLIVGSLLLCLAGYVTGFPPFLNRDGVPPRTLIPDLVTRSAVALSAAVEDIVEAGEANVTIRLIKQSFAILAILLLLSGGLVTAIARVAGDVVR